MALHNVPQVPWPSPIALQLQSGFQPPLQAGASMWAPTSHLLFPNPRHVFELPSWPAPCASPQNRTGLCEEVSVRIVLFSSRASLQLLPEDWPRYPAAGLYRGMTLFKEQAP